MILQLEEALFDIKALVKEVEELGVSMGAEALKEEIAQLEEKTTSPDFWSDPQSSHTVNVEADCR